MPEMDGLEATKRIRADARFATLPIIAMTAHAMVEERERCLAAGMVDHIAKPLDPHAMLQTIARWVKSAPRGARAPGAAVDPAGRVPVVDGLDTNAGLRRVAGNRKLYLSLLRQFAERQADAAARAAAALAAREHAEAERIAHTVRGVAGNVGLDALASVAGALEKAIQARKGIKPAASAFEAELARSVAALREALGNGAQSAGDAAPMSPESAVHAAHIASLLAQSDGDAVDYLLSHGAVIRAMFAGGAWLSFEKAVNNFDFEGALGQLQKAAGERGVNLGG
jgi:HPt (histidine-containing phosphotransfer) domain-containing protein